MPELWSLARDPKAEDGAGCDPQAVGIDGIDAVAERNRLIEPAHRHQNRGLADERRGMDETLGLDLLEELQRNRRDVIHLIGVLALRGKNAWIVGRKPGGSVELGAPMPHVFVAHVQIEREQGPANPCALFVRQGKVGVELERALQERVHLLERRARCEQAHVGAIESENGLEIEVVRFRARGRRHGTLGRLEHLHRQLIRDFAGDLGLERKRVFECAVVILRPDVIVRPAVDELQRHSDLIAVAAHRAFEHMGGAELFSDLADRFGTSPIGHHRRARDDFEARCIVGERRQNLLLHAVGKEGVRGFRREILERHHRDARLGGLGEGRRAPRVRNSARNAWRRRRAFRRVFARPPHEHHQQSGADQHQQRDDRQLARTEALEALVAVIPGERQRYGESDAENADERPADDLRPFIRVRDELLAMRNRQRGGDIGERPLK